MQDGRLINEDLAPTRPEQRTWSLWNIAALWVGMAVCIPTYTLASGLVAKGWSWKLAVLCVALGNVVVLIPLVLNAHAGTKHGVPFPVFIRASFGVFGSNVPALMRALVACGWFGIQTWWGGEALYILTSLLVPETWSMPALTPAWLGISTGELVAFLAFWLLQVVIIWRGIESIRILETWAAPFLLAIGIALFAWALWRVGDLSALLAAQGEATVGGLSALGAGLTVGVAYWGTLALNIPDFTRFAKSQRDQIAGQAIGLVPTMTMFAFIGAVVTNATLIIFGTRIADPVQLLGRIGGPALTILAMLGLSIATLTTNIAANIVSPANDISNVAPRVISFRRGALLAAGLGVVIMPWNLIADLGNYLFTWLSGYGALLGAVGGIMITDYFVIRRCRLVVDDLYRRGGRYEYRGGFNWIAMVALGIGIAPNVPGFLEALGVMDAPAVFTAIYQWTWFVAFFGAGVSYLAGMAAFAKSHFTPVAPETLSSAPPAAA